MLFVTNATILVMNNLTQKNRFSTELCANICDKYAVFFQKNAKKFCSFNKTSYLCIIIEIWKA